MHPPAAPVPAPPPAGTVYYDGACGLCAAWVARHGGRFGRRGFRFVTMQSDEGRAALGLAPGELPGEMKLRLPDGRLLGGIYAVAELYRRLGWGWPLWLAVQVPGLRQLAGLAYRHVALRRRRLTRLLGLPAACPPDDACALPPSPSRHEHHHRQA
jgi:predicted DCC family thiol-disulfide oxidoreductase YuxK